jgi:branched-chain amino acid transport system substrate-binding protein
MSRFTRRSAAAGALAAAFGLTLSACASSADDSTTMLKIAIEAPLSGDSAQYGTETIQGIDLAVKQINAAGGIDGKKITVTKVDDKCEATQAATAANKIISDTSIKAVIGNVCSAATLAAMPIYERAKMPVIAASASSPELAKHGYKQFNRVIPSDDYQASEVVRTAVRGLGKKNLAILYPSDDYGQSIANISVASAKKLGARVVASQTYVTGQTKDFSALLANIAKAKPDVLILGGYYADMGAAVKQSARSFGGQDITLLGGGQIQQPDYVKLSGATGEGTLVSALYNPSNTSGQNQSFVKAYKAEFGEDPGTQAALGHANVYVLKAAIEENKGSTQNLSAAVRKVTYDGPLGTISFDKSGDNTGSGSVVAVLKSGSWALDQDLTDKLGVN